MTNAIETQDLLDRATQLLKSGESAGAIRLARQATRRISDPVVQALNLSAFLIDSGSDLGQPRLIREGVEKLKAVAGHVQQLHVRPFHYNLGNGYAALGQRERGFGPGTRPSLSEAVSHLDEAIKLKPDPNARANLAGALLAQGRWIEALDDYNSILDQFPDHHSALARRGSALIGTYNWTVNHKGLLAAALADHERAAELARGDRVFERSYRAVIADLRKEVDTYSPSVTPPTAKQRWIWQHALALNPCPICRVETPDAFDIYPLAGRLEGGKRRPSGEELADLVNSVCRSYGTSRWLLYKAVGPHPPREPGHIIALNGTETATNILRVGLVMSAASGFYSVLSQVAFALNSAFHLNHDAQKVTLDRVWSQPGRYGRLPRFRNEVHPKLIRMATPALSALFRLTQSLQHGLGRYGDLRELRNSLEHHCVVVGPKRNASPYYVSYPMDDLITKTFTLGRIAKAAVWYLGGGLLRGEQERVRRASRLGRTIGYGRHQRIRRH